MNIYTYSNCTSCRNAESLAAKHGVAASKRDLFKQPLTVHELKELFETIGRSPSEVLATRSRPYRDLGLAEQTLDPNEILQLMAAHPALIRRPIVVVGRQSTIGFNREAIEQLIAQTPPIESQGVDHA